MEKQALDLSRSVAFDSFRPRQPLLDCFGLRLSVRLTLASRALRFLTIRALLQQSGT